MVSRRRNTKSPFMYISILALALAVAALGISVVNYMHPQSVIIYKNASAGTNVTLAALPNYSVSGPLIAPQLSLQTDPVITAQQQFGKRLTNINAQLNATELAAINNEPLSNYEIAGEMLLNGTLNDVVGGNVKKINPFLVDGKPSVIYLGSITCIYCGENRWAMALALSQFGSFGHLFKGYSSLGDSDVPTLYWMPTTYTNASTDFGNFYSSNYINLITIEDTNPITGGFALNPITTMQSNVNATGNTAYIDAMQYIIDTNDFQGTPFTVWGGYEVNGADAVVFGNSMPSGSTLPLENMTHEQVLSQISSFNDQFSYAEYAAADFYIAQVCTTINNTAPICTISAIKGIQAKYGT